MISLRKSQIADMEIAQIRLRVQQGNECMRLHAGTQITFTLQIAHLRDGGLQSQLLQSWKARRLIARQEKSNGDLLVPDMGLSEIKTSQTRECKVRHLTVYRRSCSPTASDNHSTLPVKDNFSNFGASPSALRKNLSIRPHELCRRMCRSK